MIARARVDEDDGLSHDRVKEVLGDFMVRGQGDRVALIVFGSAAYVQLYSPPVEATRIAHDQGITIHTIVAADPRTVDQGELDQASLKEITGATGGVGGLWATPEQQGQQPIREGDSLAAAHSSRRSAAPANGTPSRWRARAGGGRPHPARYAGAAVRPRQRPGRAATMRAPSPATTGAAEEPPRASAGWTVARGAPFIVAQRITLRLDLATTSSLASADMGHCGFRPP
jgi:hypothetical protein